MRILFVCLGNICRSPTAEGVMRALVADSALSGRIEIESAGTGDWHVGQAPDRRSTAAAAGRGYSLGGQARQVSPGDFEQFDLVVAMDRQNHRDLLAMAPERAERIRLLREFGDGHGSLDVPDPYIGGGDGFDQVLEIVERSCEALLAELTEAAETGGIGRSGA